MPECVVTPFAIQPGQVLTPESCGVALRIDGPLAGWVAVWRPAERQLRHLAAPGGWLAGAGLWTREGVLQLPYSTEEVPCGVARVEAAGVRGAVGAGPGTVAESAASTGAETDPPGPVAPRPVPLQQAPLGGLVTK